jgi:hypothetical protein
VHFGFLKGRIKVLSSERKTVLRPNTNRNNLKTQTQINIMRTKVNFEEIEQRLDFEALSKNLDQLTASGGLKRRKSVHDLLDKMKPALLRARENRVSLEALTKYLVTSGIPISEPTLRLYLSEAKGGKSKKKATKNDTKLSTRVTSPTEPVTVTEKPSTETNPPKKTPPRLARREKT